jgi:hypothetical protein
MVWLLFADTAVATAVTGRRRAETVPRVDKAWHRRVCPAVTAVPRGARTEVRRPSTARESELWCTAGFTFAIELPAAMVARVTEVHCKVGVPP